MLFPQLADEAKKYVAMEFSTSDRRVVPLPGSRDVLTDILRQGAQQLLSLVVEAKAGLDSEFAKGREVATRDRRAAERARNQAQAGRAVAA